MADLPSPIPQAAAIPIRAGRVCLVLSSSGKEWGIPKGNIEPGHTAGETALREAWEEAGLVGVLAPEPAGTFLYEKCGHTCHVTAFLMHVTDAADAWPEQDRRPRRWLRPAAAVARVAKPGLRKLLRRVLTGAGAKTFP